MECRGSGFIGITSTVPVIDVTNSTAGIIRHCQVTNGNDGIVFRPGRLGNRSCYNWLIESVTIANNNRFGVDLQRASNQHTYITCDLGSPTHTHGMRIIDCNTVSLITCNINAPTVCGVLIDAMADKDCTTIAISGCLFENGTSSIGDIQIGNTATVHGVSIIGSNFIAADGNLTPIDLRKAEGVTITGNTVHTDVAYGTNDVLVNPSDVDGVNICGNSGMLDRIFRKDAARRGIVIGHPGAEVGLRTQAADEKLQRVMIDDLGVEVLGEFYVSTTSEIRTNDRSTGGVITAHHRGTDGGFQIMRSLFMTNTGAAATLGNAELVAGIVTVSTTEVSADSHIFLSRKATGGTVGTLSYTIAPGTSFTIISSSSSDTSTVSWLIVDGK